MHATVANKTQPTTVHKICARGAKSHNNDRIVCFFIKAEQTQLVLKRIIQECPTKPMNLNTSPSFI